MLLNLISQKPNCDLDYLIYSKLFHLNIQYILRLNYNRIYSIPFITIIFLYDIKFPYPKTIPIITMIFHVVSDFIFLIRLRTSESYFLNILITFYYHQCAPTSLSSLNSFAKFYH
jgi:hypothetical protein